MCLSQRIDFFSFLFFFFFFFWSTIFFTANRCLQNKNSLVRRGILETLYKGTKIVESLVECISNQQNFSNASSRFRALVAGLLLHDLVYLENLPRNLLQDYSLFEAVSSCPNNKVKRANQSFISLQP